ncbi:PIN domain nuclease [Candidatus Margulisiibacteriota bacterium]
MNKTKLYLDTSIINFVFADDAPDKKVVTIDFFKAIKNKNIYELFISDLVLEEISKAKDPLKSKLIKIIQDYNFTVLNFDEEAEQLGNKYVTEGLIPAKYDYDAFHIAVAAIANMHAIISWNFKHIVKMKTIEGVQAVNLLLGYKPISIYSPLEVV